MSAIEFPFWIVFDKAPTAINTMKFDFTVAHLFTTADRLFDHLGRMLGRHSQVTLIECPQNLLLAVADLHQCKIAELDIDPDALGISQSSASIREMLLLCNVA